MELQALLRRERNALVQSWIDATLEIYPAESAKFFRETRDRFRNPAGSAIAEEIGLVFDAFLEQRPDEEFAPHLERIIRITCIQDVLPSQALAFVFRLKELIRERLGDDLRGPDRPAELARLEERIDGLVMAAFDSYAAIQKRIYDIRVQEVRGKVSTLLKMTRVNWDDLPCGGPPMGGCG